jgi:hypothetical protein
MRAAYGLEELSRIPGTTVTASITAQALMIQVLKKRPLRFVSLLIALPNKEWGKMPQSPPKNKARFFLKVFPPCPMPRLVVCFRPGRNAPSLRRGIVRDGRPIAAKDHLCTREKGIRSMVGGAE